jgi:hypothetical protein
MKRDEAAVSYARTVASGLYFLPFVLAMFLFGTAAGLGQVFTATLTGIVTDPQGAVVANAALELRDTNTNAVRHVVTASDGRYTFSQLAPGTYELTATATGFKKYVQSGITLLAARSAALNITLELGSVSQTVQVSARGVMLDTQSANQSTTLTRATVEALPTSLRTPFAFVFAMAGTTALGEGGSSGLSNDVDPQDQSRFALNGGRDMNNLILIDGVPSTASDWGGLMVLPAIDTVQEMQVTRSTYDAQYGRTGGGVVSIVTKSGSNQLHGEAYDYFRNSALDANSWSDNAFGSGKPPFKRNEFGGDIGGAISKSRRVYFFAAYDGLRQPYSSDSGLQSVPTAAQRNGDFSQTYNPDGSLAVIYNPFSTRPDPNNPGQFLRDPFDAACVGVSYPNTCSGNAIPQNLIDAVGQKVIGLFPAPNRPGDALTQANNFFKVGSGDVVNDIVSGRIDWAHSAKHTMFVRWTQGIRVNNDVPCFYCNGADTNFNGKNPDYQAVWGNTLVPSPTTVINVLVSASRWNESQVSPSTGVLTPASIGLNPAEFQAQLIPNFNFENYSSLGDDEVRNFVRYANSLQVNATHVRGAHAIQFGFMGESDLLNNIDRFSAQFNFNRGMTSGSIAQQDSSITGNSIASLLLGTGSGGSATLNPDIAASMPYYALYAQDTWHATRKLNLIYGLRYEIQPGATERFNRWSLFDFNATNPLSQSTGLPLKGGFVYASPGNRGLWQTDTTNFAPRVGLAYQVKPNLVVRAGFGVFYMQPSALITFDSPGQSEGFSTSTAWVSSVGGGGLVPQDLLSNPFPNGKSQPTGSAQGLLTQVGQGLFQIWPKGPHPTGYMQNYSFDIQYEFSPGTVLTIGFNGWGARDLVFGNPSLNANQLNPQYLSMGNALNNQVANPFAGLIPGSFLNGPTIAQYQLLLPYPEFANINFTRSLPGATANYDALTLKFTHQFSGGLMLLADYQWSKELDDASENQGWEISDTWRDYYHRKLDYSVGAADIPQSFVTSLVYQLPFGSGKRFAGSATGALNQVIGGWQASTIVRLQSGFPIQVQGPNLNGNYGFQVGYPNLVSTKALNIPNRTPAQWFNTCSLLLDSSGNPTIRSGCSSPSQPVAWVAAPPFTIGNAPRYISNLREDWIRNVDFSLAKTFQVSERVGVQFRADFLNLFNTPQFGGLFGTIDSFFSSNTFGQAFGTINNPRNIQLGLRISF